METTFAYVFSWEIHTQAYVLFQKYTEAPACFSKFHVGLRVFSGKYVGNFDRILLCVFQENTQGPCVGF